MVKERIDGLDQVLRVNHLGNFAFHPFIQSEDGAYFLGVALRLLHQSVQEKADPAIPVSLVRYRLQTMIIEIAVLFEI